MKTFATTAALIAVVLAGLPGCGTIKNFGEFHNQAPSPPTGRNLVYGGVLYDLEMAGVGFILCFNPFIGAFWLADLPLSAVGDTVTLPIMLRKAAIRRAAAKQQDAKAETVPPAAPVDPAALEPGSGSAASSPP